VTSLGASLLDRGAKLKDAPFTTHLPASGQLQRFDRALDTSGVPLIAS
jgi:hypothetical protein